MFGNLGVHIIKFPSGRFGFVGTLPANLGNIVSATKADVMAQRSFWGRDGELYAVKFPTFNTLDQAFWHAEERGAKITQGPV